MIPDVVIVSRVRIVVACQWTLSVSSLLGWQYQYCCTFLALVVFVLAAGLQVQLVDPPVLEVVTESEDTHLLYQVELSRPVEVQDGTGGHIVKFIFLGIGHIYVTSLSLCKSLFQMVVFDAVPERARMAVEEVLVLDQTVVITELHDGIVVAAVPEPAEPGVGKPLQRAPQHLVLHPAHVEDHWRAAVTNNVIQI